MAKKTTPSDDQVRFKLAERMICLGMISIAVLSGVAIGLVGDSQRPEMIRLVFASVLPLLGTWIGTVLAFYFAKDNFQAASDATRETLKQAGKFREDSRVSEMMTPLSKINPIQLVADMAAADELKLSALSADMRATGNYRVPVLAANNNAALLVIKQPHINDYAQQVPVAVAKLPDDATVGKLRAISELKTAVETFVIVTEAATVADVRQKMQTAPGCKDVFVTSDGTPTGSVVGWLTNSDLARMV